MRTIELSTRLPLSADLVWGRLQQPSTFLEVTRGLLGVANPGELPDTFAVGQRARLILRALHVVPIGWHELAIHRLDHAQRTIETRERSPLLRVWNHTLIAEPLPDGACRYTDRIEFDAGWLTRLAAPLVRQFFRYRQWRWRRLARAIAGQSQPSARGSRQANTPSDG